MQILLSEILRAGFPSREAFDEVASAYDKEMQDWRAHMDRVEEDAEGPQPVAPNVRDFDSLELFYAAYAKYEIELSKLYRPYPRPIAHPLIVQNVDPVKPETRLH